MKKRLLGAFIVVAVLIGSIFSGVKGFTIIFSLLSLLGFKELIDIKYKKRKIMFVKIASYVLLMLFLLSNVFYKVNIMALVIASLLVIIIPVIFYNNREKYGIDDAFYFLGSLLLLAFAFMVIINLRNSNIYKCIYIFIISFMKDTYSYIGGMLVGRSSLTEISPKKTIEGSVIGTVMSTFIGSMYYYVLISDMSFINIVIISLILSLLGEVGDLVFSFIKRSYDKKDYSNIIPGHGGILDRFDSIIFVSLGFMLMLFIF